MSVSYSPGGPDMRRICKYAGIGPASSRLLCHQAKNVSEAYICSRSATNQSLLAIPPCGTIRRQLPSEIVALAQSTERKTFNLAVAGSSPAGGGTDRNEWSGGSRVVGHF